jgi:hypothetical protein
MAFTAGRRNARSSSDNLRPNQGYYLQARRPDLHLGNHRVEIPGHITNLPLSTVQPGQIVAVRLFGKHVGQWGVDWSDCDSEYCRLANTIDTMLILDDQGTGLSNGFIRYGWEPPTYPMYGFLCWSIEPAVEHPVQASTR